MNSFDFRCIVLPTPTRQGYFANTNSLRSVLRPSIMSTSLIVYCSMGSFQYAESGGGRSRLCNCCHHGCVTSETNNKAQAAAAGSAAAIAVVVAATDASGIGLSARSHAKTTLF
jgi:hypothetical protein